MTKTKGLVPQVRVRLLDANLGRHAAEKCAKQIPRRPEGLLVMTKIKNLQRRS